MVAAIDTDVGEREENVCRLSRDKDSLIWQPSGFSVP